MKFNAKFKSEARACLRLVNLPIHAMESN